MIVVALLVEWFDFQIPVGLYTQSSLQYGYDRIHQHLTYVPPTIIRRVSRKLADVWKWFRRHEPFLNQKSPWNSQRFLKFHWHFVGESVFGRTAIWGDGVSTRIGTFFSIHIQISEEYLGFFCQSSASWLQLLGNWSRRCCRLCVGTTCGLYYYSISVVQHCEKLFLFWEPCHQEWKICEMASHIEGLICIICSATMFKLYLPTGRFGLGGTKISYLFLSNLGEFRSAWAVFIFSFSSDSNSEDKNQN